MEMLPEWKWIFLSVHLTSAIWPFGNYKGCVLDVNWDLIHQNAPVFLRSGSIGYEMVCPDEVITVGNYLAGNHRTGVIKMSYGSEMYAACPGYGNTIVGLDQPAQFATYNCLHRKNTLRMDKKRFKSHFVRCSQPVPTLIRETGQHCGDGDGIEYEVGYSITPESNPSVRNPQTFRLMWMKITQPNAKSVPEEGKSTFYRVFSCCYDPKTVRTLYSVNILHGDKIAGAEIRQARPPYIVGQASLYPPGFDVHNVYKYTHQQEVLQGLLGQMKSESMLNYTFITRGHLASEKDFVMGNWQFSSYTYLNLVPQWQSINRGHWYRLEEKIRRLADITQSTFIIATGTYGVMNVVDEYENTKELYLDPDNRLLPVPEVLWKVVFSPKNHSCIAFVMSNNPFEESTLQPMCEDICSEHGWPEDYHYAWRGRMYCCSADDLGAVISYIPEFKCSGILDYIPDKTAKTAPFNFRFRGKS